MLVFVHNTLAPSCADVHGVWDLSSTDFRDHLVLLFFSSLICAIIGILCDLIMVQPVAIAVTQHLLQYGVPNAGAHVFFVIETDAAYRFEFFLLLGHISACGR